MVVVDPDFPDISILDPILREEDQLYQWFKMSLIVPTNQPPTQPTNHLLNHPNNQPLNQPTNHPLNQPTNQPTNEPPTEPTNQRTTYSTTEPTNQRTTQPTNEPPTQSPNWLYAWVGCDSFFLVYIISN